MRSPGLFVALTHQRTGKPDEALQDFNRAIELDPKLAPAYKGRGKIFFRRGEVGKAIADFDRSITLRGERDGDAFYNRGLARLRLGQLQQAVADFDQAIAINPKDAAAYANRGTANRGTAYRRLGKTKLALRDYSQAIKLDPKDGAAWANRGVVRGQNGDKAAAVKDFEQAAKIFKAQGNDGMYRAAQRYLARYR